MSKLTKRIVDDAEVRPKEYFIWCGELKGFCVRILPTGKKTYYVDYRNKDRKQKRITIGQHGKITTEEARKLALQNLGGVTKGEDPATERATQRTSLTVKDLCAQYLDATEKGFIMGKKGQPKKASTLAIDRGRIDRHIIPLLGKKLVKDLAPADVAKFIRDVTGGKTATVEKTDKLRGKAVVEGGKGTAARTAGLLGGILSFAVSEGVIPFNPAHGVKRPADNKRTRRLTPDEYRAFGQAIQQAEEACETWQGTAGARLLALTGCRLQEVVQLNWKEVDEAGGCFRLEDSKEGASTRPVGRAAFDVLNSLTREAEAKFVLPAARRDDGAFGGLDGAIERLAKRAGLEGVTAHTLRHSFGSVAGDLGYSEPTIAAMLGHAAGTVTGRYVHHLDAVLIAAADKVSRAIDSYMTGKAEGKVVKLPRARG
ncbi:tyrosine-type recombinase/integrase [Rhodoblastus acidophilus]|nr:site-specific integrase [Rhodoblastus acidophilus]PPQ40765.1 integrase [Rhodoblastus acidophilus]RAI23043.1 integrase [Rhodoblastus acidophilus]